MKIDSSNIGMESARTYRSSSTRKFSASAKMVSLTLKQGSLSYYDLIGSHSTKENEKEEETAQSTKDEVSVDENPNEAMERLRNSLNSIGRVNSIQGSNSIRSIEQIRQRCVLYLWSMFFGKEQASRMANQFGWNDGAASMQVSTGTTVNAMVMTTDQEFSFEEEETASFSTTGTVRTADGRDIHFNLNVGMSRSFAQYYKEENVAAAAMCDPLVINLDHSVAGLSDQKFYFDLDMDGAAEEISVLERGSGFLSLDKNGDGVINDGSELFGASNGDGFADLAQYDEDGNGWIDENDSIYQKLRIWVKDDSGEDQLYALKDKNVGAIYLGNQDTDFTLRSSSSGQINGAIRKTGVFLYEDGMAGTVSHLDIAN